VIWDGRWLQLKPASLSGSDLVGNNVGITMPTTAVVHDHTLTTIFGDVIADTISGLTPYT
jgi:hypothetical protein